jgi:putative GTP pyrophosphokinase
VEKLLNFLKGDKMPALNERNGACSADAVLKAFDQRRTALDDLKETTEKLLARFLKEKNLLFQSIQSRVKDREKLKVKYIDPQKDYLSFEDIPDVVGFRIITYYLEDIDYVSQILRSEFEVIGKPDDKRFVNAETIGQFGYSAYHIDCRYSTARLQQTEYKRFRDIRFEIQITTVLGHAWAEIHHASYDRSSTSPLEEQRSFRRLAAVLELADTEFSRIREEKRKRELFEDVRQEVNLTLPIFGEQS